MVKIMRPVQNLSLRKSLVLYIVLFVMFALALSIMTASVCETVADKINEKYPNTGEKYYLTNEQGERLGEGTYIYVSIYTRSVYAAIFVRILRICSATTLLSPSLS